MGEGEPAPDGRRLKMGGKSGKRLQIPMYLSVQIKILRLSAQKKLITISSCGISRAADFGVNALGDRIRWLTYSGLENIS